VSSIKTPFCYIFVYYFGDEQLNKTRIELLDKMIEQRLDFIDLFAYEYKWSEEQINRLTPVKRKELFKRIEKRHEQGGGENVFGM
jgi:hypothetical protein